MLNIDQVCGMGLIYKFYSLDYFLNDLNNIGFKSVELWGAYPEQFVDGNDSFPSEDIVKEKIAKAGLTLQCYTPEQLLYYYNIASEDPQIRKKSIQYYIRAVDAAVNLGTHKMLMTSGWALYDQNYENAWNLSLEALQEIGEYAAKKNVVIALENLQPIESNLVNSLPTLKKMLDEINLENVKAMVDTVPLHLQGETMKEYLDTFGENLIHVHVVDGNPVGHLAWGKGWLPLDTDVQTLVDYGYSNTLTFEIAGGDFQHPGMEMRQSFNRILKYID